MTSSQFIAAAKIQGVKGTMLRRVGKTSALVEYTIVRESGKTDTRKILARNSEHNA